MKNKLLIISCLFTFPISSFGQNEFNEFLEKFIPVSYPLLINQPIHNSSLTNTEVENLLKIDIGEEIVDEEEYTSGYVLRNETFTAVIYSYTVLGPRGEATVMSISAFSKQGELIDTEELGTYSEDYDGGQTYHYYSTSEIKIDSVNVYVTNIHYKELIEEMGDENSTDSTVTKNVYSLKNGIIRKIEDEEIDKKEFSIRAKFLDFSLGDAEHYSFEKESGEAVTFDGCLIDNFDFAQGLEDSEANEDNQGWGSNSELQGKWFVLTYIHREQPLYIDSPIDTAIIITKAVLDEKQN
ncbi:MAG TPA: hypothetical protein EYM84_00205 [Flavobacteriales bacterium]|nr:hypothetical protein [Flavobacteriales bacterium]